MSQRDHGPDIDAMLRHLGRGDDLRNLPGTATEKIAVVRTAGARGLITWSRARGRYELTHFGWNELLPRQRFGVASLMASAAVGGLAGAAALAVLWSSADAPPVPPGDNRCRPRIRRSLLCVARGPNRPCSPRSPPNPIPMKRPRSNLQRWSSASRTRQGPSPRRPARKRLRRKNLATRPFTAAEGSKARLGLMPGHGAVSSSDMPDTASGARGSAIDDHGAQRSRRREESVLHLFAGASQWTTAVQRMTAWIFMNCAAAAGFLHSQDPERSFDPMQ